MATQAQIEANRRNAAKSTGPRSEEGKARSSRNALRHGLCSKSVLFESEDLDTFESQLAALAEQWQPVGPEEEHYLLAMHMAMWRSRRAYYMEAGVFRGSVEFNRKRRQPEKDGDWLGGGFSKRDEGLVLSRMARYTKSLQRELRDARAALRECQAQRREDEQRLAEQQALEKMNESKPISGAGWPVAQPNPADSDAERLPETTPIASGEDAHPDYLLASPDADDSRDPAVAGLRARLDRDSGNGHHHVAQRSASPAAADASFLQGRHSAAGRNGAVRAAR
jgi:hypothetical protein